MVNLSKRNKEEVFCIEEKDVCVENIIDYLAYHREECVYVLNDEVLVGIITYGDCLRYIQKKTELINKKYKFIYDDDKDEISELIKKYRYLNTVPVLNRDGKLLYIFRLFWGLALQDKGSRSVVINFHKLLIECNIKKIIFISAFTEYKYTKDLFCKWNITDIEILVQDFYLDADVENILYIDNDILRIYDMKNKNHCYQIINSQRFFEFMTLKNKYIKDISSFCVLVKNSYKNIAIYQKNSLTQKIMEGLNNIQASFDIITSNDLQYSVENSEYYMINNTKKIYDVIITGGFDTLYYPIKQTDKYLYNLMAVYRGYQYYWPHTDFEAEQERDIINNILPMLQEADVKFLVIEALEHNKFIEYRMSPDSIAKYGIEKEWIDIFGMKPEILRIPGTYKNGYYQFADYTSYTVNIDSGNRNVKGNINNNINNIYLFGSCQILGVYVSEQNTISAHLKDYIGDNYNIYNYGIYNWETAWQMRIPNYKKGDIVILQTHYKNIYGQSGYKVHSILEAYDNFKECIGDVTWDVLPHSNGMVHKCIAEQIYNICLKENIIDKETIY